MHVGRVVLVGSVTNDKGKRRFFVLLRCLFVFVATGCENDRLAEHSMVAGNRAESREEKNETTRQMTSTRLKSGTAQCVHRRYSGYRHHSSA